MNGFLGTSKFEVDSAPVFEKSYARSLQLNKYFLKKIWIKMAEKESVFHL